MDHARTADEAMEAQRLLLAQRAAVLAEGEAHARVRIDRLERARDLLVSHQSEICDAIAGDFGQRCHGGYERHAA